MIIGFDIAARWMKVIIHSRADERVPKDRLNRIDRRAPAQHRRRQAVPEEMRPNTSRYLRALRGHANHLSHILRLERMAPSSAHEEMIFSGPSAHYSTTFPVRVVAFLAHVLHKAFQALTGQREHPSAFVLAWPNTQSLLRNINIAETEVCKLAIATSSVGKNHKHHALSQGWSGSDNQRDFTFRENLALNTRRFLRSLKLDRLSEKSHVALDSLQRIAQMRVRHFRSTYRGNVSVQGFWRWMQAGLRNHSADVSDQQFDGAFRHATAGEKVVRELSKQFYGFEREWGSMRFSHVCTLLRCGLVRTGAVLRTLRSFTSHFTANRPTTKASDATLLEEFSCVSTGLSMPDASMQACF